MEPPRLSWPMGQGAPAKQAKMSYLHLVDEDSLFEALWAIDTELAQRVTAKRCPQDGCGGPLHDGKYARKPRGSQAAIPEEYCNRLSLCCGWCRRRALPPSCLFMGRKVYWGSAIVLVTAAVRGLERVTLSGLCTKFGVSRRTIKRWVDYFAHLLPKSVLWQRVRGHVGAQIEDNELPHALLTWCTRTASEPIAGLVNSLRLLCGAVF